MLTATLSSDAANGSAGSLCNGPSQLPHGDPGSTICVICRDEKPTGDTITAPCDHNYCTACINELFQFASRDESLWPASCCQKEIPLAHACRYLEHDICKHYEQQSKEFSSIDRTYCCNTACLIFMPSKCIDGDRATCASCHSKTCIICKSGAHDGDCPDDPAVQSLMETAAKEGFRQCFNCKRMIELTLGCFHIQ